MSRRARRVGAGWAVRAALLLVLAAPAGAEEPVSSTLFGLGAFSSDEPISIRSDQLEATQSGGARRLDFRGSVVVVQANMKLQSDRLRAFYQQGSNQPERLVADGSVRVVQGDHRARCDHATYDVTGEQLLCKGAAQVVDGPNQVQGEQIVFDLAAEKVTVTGGAVLLIYPKGGSPAAAESGG